MKIPFLDLSAPYQELRADLDASIARVVSSGWFIGGPEVEEFEADHAFANPTSKSFNDGESQRAWSHTLKFLKEHLE